MNNASWQASLNLFRRQIDRKACIRLPELSSLKDGSLNVQECRVRKTFGDASDNVVFVLDQGIFNVTGLVEKMTTGLTSVLGEFSSLSGGVVAAPTIQPVLSTVNAATALLG